MTFRMRFADQIVGVFVALALAGLAFALVMMGTARRWFAQDAAFHTELPSASGLARNMAVVYKGFTIGNVRGFRLTENDGVDVSFVIFEEYVDRAREGSLVELVVSPVGLGNQFLFHPGAGAGALGSGGFVPALGSEEAAALIRRGVAREPRRDDSIAALIGRVNEALEAVTTTFTEVNAAIGAGSGETVIGQVVGSVQRTLAGAEALPGSLDSAAAGLREALDGVTPILADVGAVSARLADPEGAVARALDPDEAAYRSLTASLESLSGILASLNQAAAALPREAPRIAALVGELRTALRSAEDVLTALTNNPLLRDGVPRRVEGQATGVGPLRARF